MKKKTIRKIELLAPAGDLERLKTAVVFGADAVYCGLPEWSLRNPREITFTLETLKEGIKFAHERGVKVYLTFNIFLHENQLREIKRNLKEIQEGNLKEIDGVIVSDLGMLSLVKKHLPKVPIHISTQVNTLNSEAVKMWEKLGAQRVVLARELTLEEIREIRKEIQEGNLKKIQLEVFGHGAMCMAYSGRCLLSKYFTGREANLGDCAQSCRWRYKIKSQISNLQASLDQAKPDKSQNYNSKLKSYKLQATSYFLEEETRPGDLLEVQEDENGTYFMNSKEICCLDILDQFIESGIDSLKIEGRAKSIYYLAVVTRVYRKAIDAYYKLFQISNLKSQKYKVASQQYKKLIKELMGELNLIQNRGYSHGFLTGRDDYEQEYNVAAFRPNVIPVGQILEMKNLKTFTPPNIAKQFGGARISNVKSKEFLRNGYLVEVKNKFKVGDKVEILTPDKIIKTEIKEIKNEKEKILNEILKPQEKVWITFCIKKEIPERSILRKKIK